MNEELDRLLELDPVKAHDQIMRALRPPPVIVHKEYTGRQPPLPDDTNGNGNDPPLFNDDQLDVLAQAIADLRIEFQGMVDDAVGPLNEAVALLQGQVSTLLSLINTIVSNNNNSGIKEASETRTKTVRRVRQIESKQR